MSADPTWRRLRNGLLGRLGLKPRPVRSCASAVTFEAVTDAIYSHAGRSFMVPVDRCYYPYGYSYGPTGWHPFVATLLELVDELAALGYEALPVAFPPNYPRAIHLSDVESWPLVHGGV